MAAWNALVVILTAIVTLVGLRQGVRWAILHEMDSILTEDAAEIALGLQALPSGEFEQLTEELSRKAIGHRHHGWFVQLLTADGSLIWKSADAPGDLPPAVSTARSPVTVNDFRITQHRVSVGPSQVATIRVGATLHFLREEMARIDRLVLIAAGAVLLVAPLCGYWLARRAARTMGEMIRTAARLRPSRLDERLPVHGTGDELDELATTVNRLLDRVAAYLTEKQDLLANSAHELRTPLAAIRSSVEVALNSDRTRDEYEELLLDVIDRSAALETLVNQLLLISESEADRFKLEREPVRFHDIVARAMEMFRGVAESRELTLSLNRLDESVVPGNGLHLRQVVNNLIDNSIKYTPTGGRIDVNLTAANGTCRFTVRDTGPGITPTDLPHIFERFYRADRSRTRDGSPDGNGLGLSICKSVVTAHDGEIHCESHLGTGTTMTVTLPLHHTRLDTAIGEDRLPLN
jgi:signal transduction histidine kinase